MSDVGGTPVSKDKRPRRDSQAAESDVATRVEQAARRWLGALRSRRQHTGRSTASAPQWVRAYQTAATWAGRLADLSSHLVEPKRVTPRAASGEAQSRDGTAPASSISPATPSPAFATSSGLEVAGSVRSSTHGVSPDATTRVDSASGRQREPRPPTPFHPAVWLRRRLAARATRLAAQRVHPASGIRRAGSPRRAVQRGALSVAPTGLHPRNESYGDAARPMADPAWLGVSARVLVLASAMRIAWWTSLLLLMMVAQAVMAGDGTAINAAWPAITCGFGLSLTALVCGLAARPHLRWAAVLLGSSHATLLAITLVASGL